MSSTSSQSKPKSRIGSSSRLPRATHTTQSSNLKKKILRPASGKEKPSSQPLITGFGNARAIFGKEDKEEILHPHIIKMARKSGQLNLANRGMLKIPQKVFHLNELDAEEKQKLTVTMSFDDNEDRWWEQTDLTRLYLSSNALTEIDPLISNLEALQLLDLTDNRLRSLPSELKELRALSKLLLSHNDLTELPDELCRLDDLRVLAVDHNSLTALPRDIGSLCVLEQLDASHNAITSLPPSIGYLQRLSKLNLSDNKIAELPIEIGDLFGLVNLDLTRNCLTSLPSSVSNLPKLEELGLRQNWLRTLPVLSNQNLKELYLGANKIKKLEMESLEALAGLRVLDLSDNGIETLPDEITLLQTLQRLDLTNNYLSNLPYHMGLLPHLKAMPLDGNPLRLIRRDIVQRGTTQLLKYLASKLTEPPNTYPGFASLEWSVADGASRSPMTHSVLQSLEQPLGIDLWRKDGKQGFANYVPEAVLVDEKVVPDQYEMRNMRAMVYNMKAKHIPDQLFENGRLAQVRTANLSQNILTEVPVRLSDLSSHLHELNVSHNCLTSLPDFLSEFNRLQFIDAQNNRLNTLPAGLAKLGDLREINISYNRFEALPDVVYNIASLEILFAGDNKIVKIDAENLLRMERLATLDLRNNSIDFVPPSLGKMTQLMSIQLQGNAFRVPRHDILAKGTKPLLEYLRSRIVEK